MSTDQKPPSRTAEQFVVRFPDGMRDRIAEAAKANNRSMNAEIVARLEASFKEVEVPAVAAPELEAVARRMQLSLFGPDRQLLSPCQRKLSKRRRIMLAKHNVLA
ncbi:Arc family DNA-binding protein [Derxia gummosa]|uniref:Arc family DNA-binding protein n=1 Tax=Derxia gummosa DSM 723 TaxID=1121388 RepID=A0A8B6X320_9BURK|nr:Arc family DNA-binding protein [Derxia gummosa]